jgi:molybdopterin synthase catalytic subunit
VNAATILQADVVARSISVDEVSGLVTTDADGAVVTFAGVVRDHDDGRSVTSLDYEAHPDAKAALHAVAESVAEDFPSVRIAVLHRVGQLAIGEIALAAAVASPHRAEAFAACALLIDRVKERTPIWKLQRFSDGSEEWVQAL